MSVFRVNVPIKYFSEENVLTFLEKLKGGGAATTSAAPPEFLPQTPRDLHTKMRTLLGNES